MNRPWHLFIGIIVFLVLWSQFDKINITMVFIAIAITIFPDVDAGTSYHRNFLTHSILIWITVWFYNPSLITALVCLAVGIHCLLDITFYPSSWVGDYCIKFTTHSLFWFSKNKRGLLSTLWLFGNFIVSVVILIVEVLR